jgi:hypothetical protein
MLLVVALLSLSAQAESWCAYPLYAHEWGVQVFSADGAPQAPVELPNWFHRGGSGDAWTEEPVRTLPADSGVRALPVVQFYAPAQWSRTVPLGVEVGFTQGEASVWYPQVDQRRPAAEANGGAARRSYGHLAEQRANRQPYFGGEGSGALPGDPRAQLLWDRLELSPDRLNKPMIAGPDWLTALRDLDALWVNRGSQTERFLFYEADTRERPALRVERGETWAPDRPHYLLVNDSAYPVHDVFVLAERGSQGFYAPQIPAGASAGFLLDGPGPDDPRAHLRQALVDHAQPAPAEDYSWAGEDCVMGRDPAVPITEASGHRLYAAEVDIILDVWAPRLFAADDTVILYREDTEALAELMPLGIYTDMFHFVDLRRLGLVLWEGLDLEAMSAE